MSQLKNYINDLFSINKSYKAKKADANYIHGLSEGNKKLKNNDNTRFLIWSIPAQTTCPFATELCKIHCYAKKAENAYPDCLPYRTRNFYISRENDFAFRMIYTIETELSRSIMQGKKVVIRIHESGDFYNRDYVNKWLEIMRYFENNKHVVFVAYTKSVIFFDGVKLPKNFYLLASVWSDTKENNLEIIKRNNFKIYTAFDGDDYKNAIKSGDFTSCRCNDCATCGKCWSKSKKNIVCLIH